MRVSGKSKKKSKAKKEQDLDPSITVPEDEVGRNLLGEELEKKNLVENAIRYIVQQALPVPSSGRLA